ncbi:hypothetical protein SAMN06296386_11295 [Lachnospiraceae bacterium]|nr:hypothetical protein SAMN06296386_11295 [Lachnospiraceae bacterium]
MHNRRTILHSTAQHSTAQHSTAQHSTAQHSTVDNCGLFYIIKNILMMDNRRIGRGFMPCQVRRFFCVKNKTKDVENT